jgi:hypothetical protein
MTIKRDPKPCASGCYYHITTQMFSENAHKVLVVTSWGRLRYAMVFIGWEPLEVDRKRLARAIRAARNDARKSRKDAA